MQFLSRLALIANGIEDEEVLNLWESFIRDNNLEDLQHLPIDAVLLTLRSKYVHVRDQPAEKQFNPQSCTDDFRCCPPYLSKKAELQRALFLKLLNLQIKHIGEQEGVQLNDDSTAFLNEARRNLEGHNRIIDLLESLKNYRWGDTMRLTLSTMAVTLTPLLCLYNSSKTPEPGQPDPALINTIGTVFTLLGCIPLGYGIIKRWQANRKGREIKAEYAALINAPDRLVIFPAEGGRRLGDFNPQDAGNPLSASDTTSELRDPLLTGESVEMSENEPGENASSEIKNVL